MSNAVSRPITKCQACNNSTLESFLFVGYIPPVNTMPLVGRELEEQRAFPLELIGCPECKLVQIGLEVNADVLFPPDYPYLSSSTKILRDNFAQLEQEATERLGLTADSLIVDIGSNDGTLLSNFKKAGYKVLGVEPSQAGKVAQENGIETRIAFFGKEEASKVRKDKGNASLVTAANCFAHIGNVHGVIDGIKELIEDKGVFISENHYLMPLIETLQYDTIYHEHLRYYSLTALANMFKRHDLEIFHARPIPTHGGSIRVYTAKRGTRKVESSVNEILEQEQKAGIADLSALRNFRSRVSESKLQLMAMLKDIKKSGAKIYGIGAPSRASTLINYVGLDDSIVDAVMEVKGSRKIGKYIPGTRIPVLEETPLYENQPEYALLLSWHIAEELSANLRKHGYKGKFIVPLPEPHIID